MEFIDLKTQYQRLKPEIQQRIDTVLNHGQYIMGPEIAELEKVLADYVGVKHCISLSSGTDALLIAMMALGIGRGDEVITTSFTFIATAETIALLGATPVFVDIDPISYNIDPKKIEKAITAKTKAIMPVSLYGQVSDMNAINAIAAKHGLPVIEDAAQSFGSEYQGKRSCATSTIGCTSFFPSKPLGCYGDGGANFTDDDTLATDMRQIRVHGQDRRYHHRLLGMNGRLDTLQAAILLAKFATFQEEVLARRRIGQQLSDLLKDHVQTPFIAEGSTSVYGQYTIMVDNREDVLARLKEKGIPTAVHYPIPIHQQPIFSHIKTDCPISDELSKRVMSLPMHPYLTDAQIKTIAESVIASVTTKAMT